MTAYNFFGWRETIVLNCHLTYQSRSFLSLSDLIIFSSQRHGDESRGVESNTRKMQAPKFTSGKKRVDTTETSHLWVAFSTRLDVLSFKAIPGLHLSVFKWYAFIRKVERKEKRRYSCGDSNQVQREKWLDVGFKWERMMLMSSSSYLFFFPSFLSIRIYFRMKI